MSYNELLTYNSLPLGLQSQGNTLHTCGRRQSLHGLWCRRPPQHHLHDEYQYQCTELAGDT